MWPRRKADRLLEEMIRENGLRRNRRCASAAPFSPFGRKRKPVPFTAEPTAKSRDRRSDLTVAAPRRHARPHLRAVPWYIFFNPDEFGVRAMKFGGSGMGDRADRARRPA